jgi:hypothetical protein
MLVEPRAMTEDELIEKMARAAEPAAHGPAWELAKEAQRRALAAIREAVGDPLTLVAHIRELKAMNEDFLEQITVQTESVLFKELQETIARNNALFAENVALREREVT